MHGGRAGPAAVEHVAAVDDQVDQLMQSGLQGRLHRGQMIGGSGPSSRAADQGEFGADVGVGEVQDAHVQGVAGRSASPS